MGQKTEEESESQIVLILLGTSVSLDATSTYVSFRILISGFDLFLCLRNSHEYLDAPKTLPRLFLGSDDEENAKIVSSCTPLSVLLIPSLKEVNTQ